MDLGTASNFIKKCEEMQFVSASRKALQRLDLGAKEILYSLRQIANCINHVLNLIDELARLDKAGLEAKKSRVNNIAIAMERNLYEAATRVQLVQDLEQSSGLNQKERETMYGKKTPSALAHNKAFGLVHIINDLQTLFNHNLYQGFDNDDWEILTTKNAAIEKSNSYRQKLSFPDVQLFNWAKSPNGGKLAREESDQIWSRLEGNFMKINKHASNDLIKTVYDFLIYQVLVELWQHGIEEPESIGIRILENPLFFPERQAPAIITINGENRPANIPDKVLERLEKQAYETFIGCYNQRILPHYKALDDFDFYEKNNFSFEIDMNFTLKDANSPKLTKLENLKQFKENLDALSLDYGEETPYDLKLSYHLLERTVQSLIRFFEIDATGDDLNAELQLKFAYRYFKMVLDKLNCITQSLDDQSYTPDPVYLVFADKFMMPISELLTVELPEISTLAARISQQPISTNTEQIVQELEHEADHNLAIGYGQSENGQALNPKLSAILDQSLKPKVQETIAQELAKFIIHDLHPCSHSGPIANHLVFTIKPQDWNHTKDHGLKSDEIHFLGIPEGLSSGWFDPKPIVDDLRERLRLALNHYLIPKLANSEEFRKASPNLFCEYAFDYSDFDTAIVNHAKCFWQDANRNEDQPGSELPFPPEFSLN